MSRRSWLPVAVNSPFSLANVPFGIISTKAAPQHRPATVIGTNVIDLKIFAEKNGFTELEAIRGNLDVFSSTTLNDFAALGRPVHSKVRAYLQDVLTQGSPKAHILQNNDSLRQEAILPLGIVTLHLPMDIGDYTDFFAGINHAFAVGSMFRGAENALQPNYRHLPVAYHGRASSVVVSKTPIRRPSGQILALSATGDKVPTFSPSCRLDIELEIGAFICKANPIGQPVALSEASQYIFGYVLMNDWSARDIQVWEYVPLGPFNAKNFGTTISPRIVLPDALEPFSVPGLPNETDVLPYLQETPATSQTNQHNVQLKVTLIAPDGSETIITQTNARNLIWSFPQMLAHHTVSGCPMRPGDLLGSGTISGPESTARGSMLEQNMGGRQKIKLVNGDERLFLLDGDEVRNEGVCGTEAYGLVGFGDCSGKILEAIQFS